jgi:hypothetical protein
MATDLDPVEQALAAVIQAAASPQVQEAQVLLLRRLALEGSVLPSRIPAPANITEFGGYLNLLAAGEHAVLRMSAIASALGLASPAAVSWDESPPSLGMRNVGNDRALLATMLNAEAVAALALTVPMRGDFALAWQQAVVPRLAALGAALPLWAPPAQLPPADALAAPADPLPALGRVVFVAPEAALEDPDRDPVVIGRADPDPAATVRVMLRVSTSAAASAGIAPMSFHALAWDTTAATAVVRAIGTVPLVPMADVVALAGFSVVTAPLVPSRRNDLGWARLVNRSGLLSGMTTLGDELKLVWTAREIARSAFAKRLAERWNGSAFVAD